MNRLSVVIITYNEERNIARCLDSVKEIADDIVVLDSFSTDRTRQICMGYEVKFIERIWEGYSASKNFANSMAEYDWVLSLDADEALSDQLRESIIRWKSTEMPVPASFNRLTNYCGHWIRHCGWYPDTKLRIFDRRNTQWEGSIHEQLVSAKQEAIHHLNGDLLHYSYYSIEEHYRQAEKFSTLSAENLFARGKRTNMLAIFLRPAAKFLRNYFLKLGFLDGAAGFTVCRISAYENYLKYKKLLRLQDQAVNRPA